MMEMSVPNPMAIGAGPQIHPEDVIVLAEVIVVYRFK